MQFLRKEVSRVNNQIIIRIILLIPGIYYIIHTFISFSTSLFDDYFK